MGYCCGQKLSFTPLVQFCFGITKNNAACVIARDQPYFMYECSSSGFGVTVAEKYIYCVKCFEALPEKGINLNENTSDPPKFVFVFYYFFTRSVHKKFAFFKNKFFKKNR